MVAINKKDKEEILAKLLAEFKPVILEEMGKALLAAAGVDAPAEDLSDDEPLDDDDLPEEDDEELEDEEEDEDEEEADEDEEYEDEEEDGEEDPVYEEMMEELDAIPEATFSIATKESKMTPKEEKLEELTEYLKRRGCAETTLEALSEIEDDNKKLSSVYADYYARFIDKDEEVHDVDDPYEAVRIVDGEETVVWCCNGVPMKAGRGQYTCIVNNDVKKKASTAKKKSAKKSSKKKKAAKKTAKKSAKKKAAKKGAKKARKA